MSTIAKVSGPVSPSDLPALTGVSAYENVAAFPAVGQVGKSYVDLSSASKDVYRWEPNDTPAVPGHYDLADAAHYVVVSFADLPTEGTTGLVYLDADNIGANTPTKTWDGESYLDGATMAIVTAENVGAFPPVGDTDDTYIDLSDTPSDGYSYTAPIPAVGAYLQYAIGGVGNPKCILSFGYGVPIGSSDGDAVQGEIFAAKRYQKQSDFQGSITIDGDEAAPGLNGPVVLHLVAGHIYAVKLSGALYVDAAGAAGLRLTQLGIPGAVATVQSSVGGDIPTSSNTVIMLGDDGDTIPLESIGLSGSITTASTSYGFSIEVEQLS